LQIDVVTIFPEFFDCLLKEGMISVAVKKNILKINVHNLRNFTHDKHKQVDDTPYGGGPGMVMKPEPFFETVTSITQCNLKELKKSFRVILFTPQGKFLEQKNVQEFAKEERMILLCPRYEGIDERVREHLITDEISIGDFVVSGGEFPAIVFMEAVTRMIPGVLGDELSLVEESFSDGLLEYPQYTRPRKLIDWEIPEILLSGNHAEIKRWRRKEALKRTMERRPDLIERASLTDADKKLLREIKKKIY